MLYSTNHFAYFHKAFTPKDTAIETSTLTALKCHYIAPKLQEFQLHIVCHVWMSRFCLIEKKRLAFTKIEFSQRNKSSDLLEYLKNIAINFQSLGTSWNEATAANTTKSICSERRPNRVDKASPSQTPYCNRCSDIAESCLGDGDPWLQCTLWIVLNVFHNNKFSPPLGQSSWGPLRTSALAEGFGLKSPFSRTTAQF